MQLEPMQLHHHKTGVTENHLKRVHIHLHVHPLSRHNKAVQILTIQNADSWQ